MDDAKEIKSPYDHTTDQLDESVGLDRERAMELLEQFHDEVEEGGARPSECIEIIEHLEANTREKLFVMFQVAGSMRGI